MPIFKPPPERAHEAAVALQLSVTEPPLVTLVGDALNDPICGGGTAVTVTVADVVTPSELLQVSVYVVVAVTAPVPSLPLAARPLTFKLPPAMAQVAPGFGVALQLSVELPPLVTLVGEALNDPICGGGTTVTVAVVPVVPPAPVQLSVKLVVAARFPVDTGLYKLLLYGNPLRFKLPPVSVQETACCELQVSVAAVFG